jgi:hypothetical protein
MTNHRYNVPDQGTLDWHIPLNENFERLDRDVEFRDLDSNKSDYEPSLGAKFLATDSGATYTGDGESWNLVGYVTRAGGGDFGHYVTYEAGIQAEEINRFTLDDTEQLEVVRVSLPVKGTTEVDPNVTLNVSAGGSTITSISGNELKSAATSDDAPWVASESPVSVTVTNDSDGPVNVVPKVWVNIRR